MSWMQILKEDPIGWIIGLMDRHFPSMQIIPRPDYYFFGTEQQVIEETKKYQEKHDWPVGYRKADKGAHRSNID